MTREFSESVISLFLAVVMKNSKQAAGEAWDPEKLDKAYARFRDVFFQIHQNGSDPILKTKRFLSLCESDWKEKPQLSQYARSLGIDPEEIGEVSVEIMREAHGFFHKNTRESIRMYEETVRGHRPSGAIYN